jgi:hypothetical protein
MTGAKIVLLVERERCLRWVYEVHADARGTDGRTEWGPLPTRLLLPIKRGYAPTEARARAKGGAAAAKWIDERTKRLGPPPVRQVLHELTDADQGRDQ